MGSRVRRAVAAILAAVPLCAAATQPAYGAPQPRDTETGRDRRTIIYVDDDNTSGPWDGTIEHPYQYIQDGIDHAAAGDTVFILAGAYLENVVVDRSVTLLGEDCETTMIDAVGLGEVVYVLADEVTISGFTMTGADGLGAIVLASNGNMISGNHLTQNNEVFWAAIYLTGSSYNDIHDNQITYTDREAAIWLNWTSCWNTISHNALSNNGSYGVALWNESEHNTISANTFRSNGTGMWIYESSHTKVADNAFIDNAFNGVFIDYSRHLLITDNAFGRGGGLAFYPSRDLETWVTHTIEDNSVAGSPIYYYKRDVDITAPEDAAQVILADCHHCTIRDLQCHDAAVPVQMGFCSSCVITDNIITVVSCGDGVMMDTCQNVEVVGNTIRSTCDHGDYSPTVTLAAVEVRNGGRNTFLGNTIRGFNQGILIRRWSDSFDNLIADNDIASKLIGIWLIEHNGDGAGLVVSNNVLADCSLGAIRMGGWPAVTLTDNTMTGCSWVIHGDELAHWRTHTVNGNTVNGQELVYRADQSHFSVMDGAGQVVLANCCDFELGHLHMSNGSVGVLGGFCSGGLIHECTFVDLRDAAIYFEASDGITIVENQISGGGHGMWMAGAGGYSITANRIADGADNGINLFDSSQSVVAGNVVTGMEGTGIRCWGVSECSIEGNAALCNGATGITLGGESSANGLSGNTLSRNGTYGVVICCGSMNNEICVNQFVGNWLSAREVYDAMGNTWHGPSGGNFWSDFADNPGYPTHYEIPGDGDGVDWDPLDSVSGCPFVCGDIDGSCSEVDFADFEAFAECWDLSADDCGDYGCSDLNGDGAVDLADFATFSRLYGTTPVNAPPDCGGE